MSKRLIMILAAIFVVGIACAAYAEVQNVKVSGDITAEAVSRGNLLLRKAAGGNVSSVGTPSTFNEYGKNINGILSHIRLRVDADLTDNVSATVRLINERVWGVETNSTSGSTASSTNVGIDLAYATMKEFLYSPLTLTIGRQELHFGNDLIMGDVDTNNLMAGHIVGANSYGQILPKSLDDLSLRKSFDAVKATLNYDPLVIDGVYAKIATNDVAQNNGVDLYGVNASYAVDKTTSVEAYYWLKERKKAGAAELSTGTSPQRAKNDTVHTFGVLGRNTSVKNLALSLELAYQLGNKINNQTIYPNDLNSNGESRKRRAYAIQLMTQYNLKDLVKKYDPMVAASYTLLSGESYKQNNKIWHGWDAMFENQAQGTLFNKIMGYSNAQIVNVTGSMKPMSDLKLTVAWSYLRLMKAVTTGIDGTTPNNVVITGVTGDPTYQMAANKKSLGNEVDAQLTYDYTEDVQLGLGAGWFMPGDAFTSANDKTASQVIGSMKVSF